MRFISTRGAAPAVPLRVALLAGPAPDGGLYMPARLEPFTPGEVAALAGGSLTEAACTVLRRVLGDEIPAAVLERVMVESLDFPFPVVTVEERVSCLELFHGPTLAFKDVGARVMAGLVAHLASTDGVERTILVATSGDTGGAIAQAFHRRPGVRVVVLFPRSRVSDRQRKQFSTVGDNVQAVEVDGSFDDCQRLARAAFTDSRLVGRVTLSSANSINLGRLLPQTIYYIHALGGCCRRPLMVATPSGNFGNLTAGLMAKRLGLPVSRFVAATNANDIVPAYLASGLFNPRPSTATLSNAMDVGHPSNFERMRMLYDDDLLAMQMDVFGSTHGDDETRQAIADVHRRTGTVLDPHSAVGYLGLKAGLRVAAPEASGVFLATAHPAKFAESVEPVIGAPVEVPARLAACLDRPETITPIPPTSDALAALLLS